jgi:ABC-type multidrug transport system fused ATPase/permease subunit
MQRKISRAKSNSEDQVLGYNKYHTTTLETLTGIHVIKSFVLERLRWAGFRDQSSSLGEAGYRLAKNQYQLTMIQELAQFVLIGGMVYLGFTVLHLNIAVIVALLYTLYRLAPRVALLNALRQSMAQSMVVVRTVHAAINATEERAVVNGVREFSGLETAIDLRNVDFFYRTSGPVLTGTDFSIEKGKMTAIVGASGAGKSTLVDLLLRYYDPIEGSIAVDGVDLREYTQASWRRSIAVVSQDVFLFNDTVATNIKLDRPDMTDEKMIDAAKKAYAHDFIMELPDGYETAIGDRGWNLSGGQRQRISLARAIVGDPDILILDEATSALDSESESLIQQSMTNIRAKCTMVVVAHRTATVRQADKIVVLQKGKIVEEGTWDSLVQQAGVFATYQHLQSIV